MTALHSHLSGTARRDERSAPWFDALATGTLLIHRCRTCDHHSRPDAVSCPACQSEDLAWVPAGGGGAVVCLIHDHSGDETLLLGLVELDEGPWVHARLVDSAGATAGSRVRLVVLPPDGIDGEHVPGFTTVDGQG